MEMKAEKQGMGETVDEEDNRWKRQWEGRGKKREKGRVREAREKWPSQQESQRKNRVENRRMGKFFLLFLRLVLFC